MHYRSTRVPAAAALIDPGEEGDHVTDGANIPDAHWSVPDLVDTRLRGL
jgi:hypothetical protein